MSSWISTNGRIAPVSFRTAVETGLAPDGGLFVPQSVPQLPQSVLANLSQHSLQQIALEIAAALIGDEIPRATLEEMINRSCSFPVPLVQLAPGVRICELFHGPTFAFKDFGARFFGELLSYFATLDSGSNSRVTTVVVATSGDTGGAVAHGLWNRPGVRVVVLYPAGQVSAIQEAQIATLGGNVYALEVSGSFDDCQRLVKQAFVDPQLQDRLRMTSANSINIARLIPQSFYYAAAVAELQRNGLPAPLFVVPSGNFGNLAAGILVWMMGLPVAHFLAATNNNDTFVEYLRSGTFTPKPSVPTLANAMDVGNPSNFARLEYFFALAGKQISDSVSAIAVTDEQIREQIAATFKQSGYVLDPHTAVGLVAASRFGSDLETVILATAHPAKFAPLVEEVLADTIDMPQGLAELSTERRNSSAIRAEFSELQQFLLQFG